MRASHAVDYDALASGLMRALRGARSQAAFSRRLGYSTNVAYAWESGSRAPTASQMLRAASRIGVNVRAALEPFFQRRLPEALRELDPSEPLFAASLLRELHGPGPMRVLAERVGLSRSAVSRILSGDTQPRLPMFLRIADAASRRVLDLLAGLVDVASIPAAKDEWRRMDALRRLAHGSPLSEAVPRFLELAQYAALPAHRPGWIAERLGIPQDEEERTLRALEAAGLIAWDGARWRIDRERSVDTTLFDRRAATQLAEHWADVARRRIAEGGEGRFAYLVFSTDDVTLAAIGELQAQFFRELRALVAASSKNERVAVANVQLLAIDGGHPLSAAPARGSRSPAAK
jgi:transcriptional regulator with XRE-family HTH domain